MKDEQIVSEAKRIVAPYKNYSFDAAVELDDLAQDVAIAGIRARDTYDSTKGASEETHVKRRMRGAVLDALRGCDVITRKHRQLVKSVQKEREQYYGLHGVYPDDYDLAESLSVDVGVLREALRNVPVSECYNDELETDAAVMSLVALVQEDVKRALRTLDDRQRIVITMIFYGSFSIREVAEVIGVSHETVRNNRDAALEAIEAYMREG